MTNDSFQAGHTYDNAYMIVVDASGHSNIVAANPRDLAARAFDLLQERVVMRLKKTAENKRCTRVDLWGWQGDGGLFVIHDDDESVAVDVALCAAMSLLNLDLRHLQDEFKEIGIEGGLHLRISVHKGSFSYLGEGLRGSIHSPDINFAAHLEKATPRDTVSISEEVYRVCGTHSHDFTLVGTFEGRGVYLFGPGQHSETVRSSWLAARGLSDGVTIHAYFERPSQHEKSRLIDSGRREIVDLGTALNTCSNYLITTERPARFRDAVLDFLRRGGTYRCVVMDPECKATEILSVARDEDLASKINRSIGALGKFKKKYGADAEGVEVYQVPAYPGMAALAVDLDLPSAMILYSPYLEPVPWDDATVERGDMPHYLLTASQMPLFNRIKGIVQSFSDGGRVERVL